LVALVLSDISGDPLELIASGPCMPVAPDPHAALEVLRRHEATGIAATITRQLERRAAEAAGAAVSSPANGAWTTPAGCRVSHVLLGSNATAVDAAARAARRLGYDAVIRTAAETSESADAVGGRLVGEAATLLAAAARDGRPRAVLEGGEAVVTVPADHGTGGRNQQTVLAAAAAWPPGAAWPTGLMIASLATDGEDGPTDAAGGLVDDEIAKRLLEGGDLPRAVARCDAYPALAAAGGLVRTGPTGTNVADVRIILARP
jgi:hydroxypyruvate reductase